MKSITVVPNSYFVKLDSNQRFDDHIDHKLNQYRNNKNSQIDWWDPKNTSNRPLHCTLAQAFSTQNHGEVFNQRLSHKISDIFQKQLHSHLLSIQDFNITKNGWVILNFQPTNKLQNLHNHVANELKSHGLKIQEKFSFSHFKAHVSIGSLKQNGDPIKASQEVQNLLKELQLDPCPFNAYTSSLEYTSPQKQEKTLTKHSFNRIDLGVQGVTKHKGKFIVTTKSKETAKKVAKVFKNRYGIESSKRKGHPKRVKKDTQVFTLKLNQQEFNKVSGHFKNLK